MASIAHLNLLHENERLTSSPVRLRVMLPVLAALAALAMAVWWAVLAAQAVVLAGQQNAVLADIESRTKAFREASATVADERGRMAEIAQLALYRTACVRYAGFLEALGQTVSDQVQLTGLSIDAPKPYSLKPAAPGRPAPLGPTQTSEPVRLRLMGRTLADAPVNALLTALRSPAFTASVKHAEIPRGAFRQEDSGRGQAETRRLLLFELNCDLAERRFE